MLKCSKWQGIWWQQKVPTDLKFRFIAFRTKDVCRYNVPTTDEVAALMVGDSSEVIDRRDVIVVQQASLFQRISGLHVGYMALQYLLLFSYDEDGWHPNIPFNVVVANVVLDENNVEESKHQRKHRNVTMAEFYGYRFQHRNTNGTTLLWGD